MEFNLNCIEEEIVAVYFAKKLQIQGEKELRKVYKFKEETTTSLAK